MGQLFLIVLVLTLLSSICMAFAIIALLTSIASGDRPVGEKRQSAIASLMT
jgi:hypothetical protein